MERRKPGKEKRDTGFGAFTAVTALAIALAIVLIVLGRLSIPKAEINVPPPVTTHPPVIASPAPSKTRTPIQTQPSSPTSIPTTNLPITNLVTYKGSLTSPVTIIEYSEFQCSHCQQFALTVEKELEAAYVDTGKVRLIYRFIVSYDESLLADEAAACAAEQGRFWPYYYLLMQQRASPTVKDLPIERLQNLAQELGLDMAKFNSSLLSRKFTATVAKDDSDGRALGVTGTPTFFINGVKKDGAKSLEDLKIIIDPILEK